MDALKWLIEHATDICAALAAVYSAALLVVKLTPTKKDDEALKHIAIVGEAVAGLLDSLKTEVNNAKNDASGDAAADRD